MRLSIIVTKKKIKSWLVKTENEKQKRWMRDLSCRQTRWKLSRDFSPVPNGMHFKESYRVAWRNLRIFTLKREIFRFSKMKGKFGKSDNIIEKRIKSMK